MLGIAWQWQAELYGGISSRLSGGSRCSRRTIGRALLDPEPASAVAGGAQARKPADPGLESGAARGEVTEAGYLGAARAGPRSPPSPARSPAPAATDLPSSASARENCHEPESPPAQGRCAIYTRKSTEEGLEQAFNSLDAQREACEAYILSQKHEGWTTLPRAYDDGGFSGGSMDRPGLRRLLADVEAGGSMSWWSTRSIG